MSIYKTSVVTANAFNEGYTNLNLFGTASIDSSGTTSTLDRNGNYITCISPDLYRNLPNWHFHIEKSFNFLTNTGEIICYVGDYSWGYWSYSEGWNSIVLNVYDVDNAQIFISVEQVRSKFVAGVVKCDLYYSNATGYNFTLTQGNNTYNSSVSSNTKLLRYSTNDLIQLCGGTYDLKTLSLGSNNKVIWSPPTNGGTISSYQTTANYFYEI